MSAPQVPKQIPSSIYKEMEEILEVSLQEKDCSTTMHR